MKRNKNILYISRDHHYGLMFCWKLRQGVKRKVDQARMRNYVAYFWENYFQPHFQEESQFLLSKVNDPMSHEAHRQHLSIQALISEIIAGSGKAQPETLKELANLVNQHIRFEEKELFPHLEQSLNTETLKSIGAALDELHSSRFKDDYPDNFWL